jgi:hypothetical protein
MRFSLAFRKRLDMPPIIAYIYRELTLSKYHGHTVDTESSLLILYKVTVRSEKTRMLGTQSKDSRIAYVKRVL